MYLIMNYDTQFAARRVSEIRYGGHELYFYTQRTNRSEVQLFPFKCNNTIFSCKDKNTFA